MEFLQKISFVRLYLTSSPFIFDRLLILIILLYNTILVTLKTPLITTRTLKKTEKSFVDLLFAKCDKAQIRQFTRTSYYRMNITRFEIYFECNDPHNDSNLANLNQFV